MTTYTLSDLTTRVLRDATLCGADETPAAADFLFAQETISSEIDLMARKGIVIWDGSEVSMPSAYYTTISRRLVAAVGAAFGLLTVFEATQTINVMEKELRILSAIPATEARVKNEYF